MWDWLRGRRPTRQASFPEELKGAPAHARVKTYSAETGFVYQYVYRGNRRLTDGLGTEHVFEAHVFQARKGQPRRLQITVRLLDAEVEQCRRSIGRELIAAELYALVKMTLFAALDHFGDAAELETPLVPGAAEMQEHLRVLGRI